MVSMMHNTLGNGTIVGQLDNMYDKAGAYLGDQTVNSTKVFSLTTSTMVKEN